MFERREFLQKLTLISAGFILAKGYGRTVVYEPGGVNISIESWKDLVKECKDRYPAILVFDFNSGSHDAWLKLRETKDRALQTIFSCVASTVLSRQLLKEHFKVEDEASNMFLIDHEGKVLKKGRFPALEIEDSEKIFAVMEEFLLGDNVWLENRQKSFPVQDPKSGEKIKELLGILAEGDFKARKNARKELTGLMKENFDVIVQAALKSKEIEVRESCRDLLISYRDKLPLISSIPELRRTDYYRRRL